MAQEPLIISRSARHETVEEFGNKLRLPPWMEEARAQIEKVLSPIALPAKR